MIWKNRKILKRILLVIGLLPFMYVLILSIIESIKYDELLGLPFQYTLDLIKYKEAFLGIILIIASVVMRDDKESLSLYEAKNKTVSSSLENDKCNSKKCEKKGCMKMTFHKFMLVLGVMPLALVLITAVYSLFTGFSFINSTSYGIEAFRNSILITMYVFWPVVLIGLVISFIAYINLKKSK